MLPGFEREVKNWGIALIKNSAQSYCFRPIPEWRRHSGIQRSDIFYDIPQIKAVSPCAGTVSLSPSLADKFSALLRC
jgi:hypothetical protein